MDSKNGNMDNTFQVELIELKAGYQHEMDVLDAMLQENQEDNYNDGVALEDITAARRELVLQAIHRFEGICRKHGANPEASRF